jgi:ABC-type dipeptide/oligopeptide/nickel transport system ATPase component
LVVLNLEDEESKSTTNSSGDSVEEEEVADLEAGTEEKKQQLGDIVTLKNIDFKIKKGEFVCIIGEVKSGKSSILSSVIGDMLYVSNNKIQKYGGEMGMNQAMCDQELLEKFQDDIVKGT